MFDLVLTVFNFTMMLALALFTGLHFTRFRKIGPEIFSAAAAWNRACIFFCACFIVSWLSGTQEMILAAPIAAQAQLQNPAWIAWTAGLTAFIFVGYWVIWARYTMRFDRRRHLLSQIPFGILWGLSVGQYILIVWHGVNIIGPGWPDWAVFLVAWIAAGTPFALWMLFYWDLYIVPEHDSAYSIVLKTIVVHIPQTFLSVAYITLYNNFAILIGVQTLALVGASIAMRMPPFWSREPTPPARRHSLFSGLGYAGGYVSSDPGNDPQLKAAHLPY